MPPEAETDVEVTESAPIVDDLAHHNTVTEAPPVPFPMLADAKQKLEATRHTFTGPLSSTGTSRLLWNLCEATIGAMEELAYFRSE